MKFLFLYIHLIAALYFLIADVLRSGQFSAAGMLIFIAYLSLSILPVIPAAGKIRKGLHLLLLPAPWLMAGLVPAMILLLPFHLLRLLAAFRFSSLAGLAGCLAPVFIIPPVYQAEYLALILPAWLVFRFLNRREWLLVRQEEKLDRLEATNQLLTRKIHRLEQIEGDREFFVKLEERNLIARKLHDELGHTLTASIVQLEAVQALLREDPPRAEGMLGRVSVVLTEGLESLRRGLSSLKPAAMDLGRQEIKQLLGEFEKNSGIRTRLRTRGELSLIPAACWQVMASNLKEALTNILRHSGASEVSFEVTVLNKLVKAAIKDNGRGAASVRPGMGLQGMEERMREAGGTLICDGTGGFSVIMIFKKEH